MLHSPDKFRESLPAGHDGVFDWDFLVPAFRGSGITPMDLDFFVERRGQFLAIETKRPGVSIPEGQRIALEALSRIQAFTVVVAWGKTAREIDRFEVWRGDRRASYRGSDTLLAFCRAWYERASAL